MSMNGALLAGMWLDDPGSLSSGNSRLLMFFVALVAVAMVVQAIVVVVASVAAMRAQKRVQAIAEEVRSRALPIMDSAEDLIKESVPKVKIIADNLLETSHIVRSKAVEFDATLTDVHLKTRAQVARVDGMVTSTLTKTGEVAEMIQQGIRGPVKQVAGIINGIRTGLDVFLSRARGPASRRRTDDEYE